MQRERILAAYQAYGAGYDLCFDRPLRAGRRRAVAALQLQAGQRALEAGVGTGLSLPFYPAGVELHGLDLSEPMLAQARRRPHSLARLELRLGDAQATGYPDGHFDAVCAVYMASVTPDPDALLRELLRVCKPGGCVVLLNHWAGGGAWRRRLEQGLAPLAERLGFDAALELDPLLARLGLQPELREPVGWLGLWTLLRLRK